MKTPIFSSHKEHTWLRPHTGMYESWSFSTIKCPTPPLEGKEQGAEIWARDN